MDSSQAHPNANGSIHEAAEPHTISSGKMSLFKFPLAKADKKPDEIAQYDRQIRLWGVDAQTRLRNANILLIGIRALGNEIAKNLVLAGINELSIIDDELVEESDLGAQFLFAEDDIGKPRAKCALSSLAKLNPRVQLKAIQRSVASSGGGDANSSNSNDRENLIIEDPVFLAPFSLVVATDLPMAQLNNVNAACRLRGLPFYAAGAHGLYGFIFADLIKHTFTIKRDRSNITTALGPETSTRAVIAVATTQDPASNGSGSGGGVVETVTKTELYSPLQLANSSPLPPYHLASLRRKRAVTPLLPCLRALWEFQRTTGRRRPELHSSTNTIRNTDTTNTTNTDTITPVDNTNTTSSTTASTTSTASADLRLFTTLATQKTQELQLPAESLSAAFIRAFVDNVDGELAPVAAVLGGRLAQDVINVIGGGEQPIQNLVLFDGDAFAGPVYALHPLFPPLDGEKDEEKR